MAQKTNNDDDDFSKNFFLDKLTSDVYGADNPPKDWADISLLIPHETIRREMQYMLKSIDKLLSGLSINNKMEKKYQSWQVTYFCEWILDNFVPIVEEHHEVEEELYFPWIQTKTTIPNNKQFSKTHEKLSDNLNCISDICIRIINKKGAVDECNKEIENLKTNIHQYVIDMKEHFSEEERNIPPLVRQYFSQEEEKKQFVPKLIRRIKLSDLRKGFPPTMLSLQEWATTDYIINDFQGPIPSPIIQLHNNYWKPDYETYITPKRDAPFLEQKPNLTQKGCFGISFCIRCIC